MGQESLFPAESRSWESARRDEVMPAACACCGEAATVSPGASIGTWMVHCSNCYDWAPDESKPSPIGRGWSGTSAEAKRQAIADWNSQMADIEDERRWVNDDGRDPDEGDHYDRANDR